MWRSQRFNSSESCRLTLRVEAQQLSTGGNDGWLNVWDISASEPLWAMQAHESALNDLSHSVHTAAVASVGEDKAVVIWDLWLAQEEGF